MYRKENIQKEIISISICNCSTSVEEDLLIRSYVFLSFDRNLSQMELCLNYCYCGKW